MDNTITENDLDTGARQFVDSLHGDDSELDSDLSVDGLSDSLLSRLYSFFVLRSS